jgi:hypothetical protein
MIQVTSLYARSFDLDHTDVFWEIESFTGNILQYNFSVLRSESSSGPWEIISPTFQDQYYFRDASPSKMSKWRVLYYLLRVTDLSTSETQDFGPTAQRAEPDLIALEINRAEDILFREFVGRICWMFPVRTFGAYCMCFDRVTGRRTKAQCLNCYDTGYLGGFLSPIQCYIQFDPNGQKPVPTPYKERQDNRTTARLISFPPIKPKDIVVEAENARWRVESSTQTQRLRAVVHQEITLREIDLGDVEYKLPINIDDLTSISPSAERNFTNPQHVDERINLQNILAVYGNKPRGTIR